MRFIPLSSGLDPRRAGESSEIMKHPPAMGVRCPSARPRFLSNGSNIQ
jgi:hypothetical protein